MQIVLNGEPRRFESETSVARLLETLGLDARRVAVEVNRRILKRADFARSQLSEGDQIEVVHFVGGG